MKKVWIAVAIVALVSANVFAATNVVYPRTTVAAQQNSGAKKASVTSKKKAKAAKEAAKAAAKAAQKGTVKQGVTKKSTVRPTTKVAQSKAVTRAQMTDTEPETALERFDEMEAMILSNDAVEEIKTVQEQTVQNAEESEVLSPSAPR